MLNWGLHEMYDHIKAAQTNYGHFRYTDTLNEAYKCKSGKLINLWSIQLCTCSDLGRDPGSFLDQQWPPLVVCHREILLTNHFCYTVELWLRPPLVSDYLSTVTSFPKYQKFPSQITIFGTSCRRPPLISNCCQF